MFKSADKCVTRRAFEDDLPPIGIAYPFIKGGCGADDFYTCRESSAECPDEFTTGADCTSLGFIDCG